MLDPRKRPRRLATPSSSEAPACARSVALRRHGLRWGIALAAVSAGFALSSCENEPGDGGYPCVRPDYLERFQARGASKEAELELGQLRQPLYAATSKIWRGPLNEIPVCWDSATYAIQSDADRELVRQAVANTWEAALVFELVDPSEWVRFTGWEECTSTTARGIHINVPYGSAEAPNAAVLGRDLDGREAGLTLTFDFTQWSADYCTVSEAQRKFCLQTVAAHEFGHALGFAHEQNRPDTNRRECRDAPNGPNGDLLLGAWDESSIMNYCNPAWNNDGELSEGDILGVRAAYYQRLGVFDMECVKTYKARLQAGGSESGN